MGKIKVLLIVLAVLVASVLFPAFAGAVDERSLVQSANEYVKQKFSILDYFTEHNGVGCCGYMI